MATATKRHATAKEVWRLLFELAFANRGRLVGRIFELGLTPPQAFALRRLDPERPVPMSELAGWLACDASNVTGLVDRLEARGLVERRAVEHDRRVKALAVTPAGVEMRKRLLDLMHEPPEWVADLPGEDRDALRDILERAGAAQT
jgi:MarR family transcriptional regulator, organic hydroperoxide resistance regulator